MSERFRPFAARNRAGRYVTPPGDLTEGESSEVRFKKTLGRQFSLGFLVRMRENNSSFLKWFR